MTASKDLSRPSSQHRLSVGSNAPALPVRTSYSRSHSHTISLGSVNGANRINRRKSSTFLPPANAAAIGAVLESAAAEGSTGNRRSSVSRAALASLNDTPYPPLPTNLPHHTSLPEGSSESAVLDGPALSSFQGIDKVKQRMRRASDGSRLTKKEKAATGDLKCEHCGKAYKHGSCLNKHLWEHTPQWQLTSKLLISKHQQVQLLEAASTLVSMTAEGHPTHDSDNSSSPAASASSDRDEASSTGSTPPPHDDTGYREAKRDSNSSSAYSRSYQSIFSDPAAFPPPHHRHWSNGSSVRPGSGAPFTTADSSIIAESYPDEDPQELAAAVGLLSCSYGTPRTGPLALANDVPPVPPLPEKYAFSTITHVSRRGGAQEDVMMDDESSDEEVSASVAFQRARGGAGHDDFEGVFGRMDA